MIERIIKTLKIQDVEIYEYLSLEKLNSMRVKSVSRVGLFPHTVTEFCNCIKIIVEKGVKFRVVGGMSNTLVENDFFDGVLIFTSNIRRKNRAEDVFTFECGVKTGEAVEYALTNGYGGIEGLRSVPGTVGGAVFGNAGAFGSSVSDAFLRGNFFDLDSGGIITLKNEEMDFSYRNSIMQKRPLLLLSADFKLEECDVKLSREKISDYSRIRRERQPTNVFSLGSIFKRVEEIGAGYYIEGAGLKGRSLGGAAVSHKHAGFIVNTGGAVASDVIGLIEIVKEAVFNKYGVLLEEEIQII